MKKPNRGVRISSSALSKPLPLAGFIKNKKNSVSSVSKLSQYRKPVIIKSESGWYIKYYFRIPEQIRVIYKGKEWYRFRIKEDINRRTGQEKEQYAEWLRSEIEESLKNGYNPFEPEQEYINREDMEVSSELGAKDAILLFMEAWKKRGLEKASLVKYNRTANRLIEWLEIKRMPYRDIREITTENIEQFLNDLKHEQGFSNREYNNTFDFTRTIFNFLLKKKYIDSSPCAGFKKQPTVSRKHRYYNDVNLKAITDAMQKIDPYIYLAFQTVYYACIRAEKELINLKVKNLLWNQNKILIEIGKGNYEAYVPMDENLKQLFLDNKINEYPPEYYVFGIKEKPSETHVGGGFFAKRFRKVRRKAGLSQDFTLYSAKHSRIIHLKQDGLDDASIMVLTRHRDFAAYARYLRDLGMDASPERINKISRKI